MISPGLKVVLFDQRRAAVNAAATQLEGIVSSLAVGDLPWHDVEVRHALSQLSPAELLARRMWFEGTSGWAVWAVCSCHANGHVRELAVRKLSDAGHGHALSFLLLRVSDWVPQVREAACAGVEAQLSVTHAAALVRALPLITRLGKLRRAQHGALVRRALELLRDARCQAALTEGLSAKDARDRSAAFAAAIENEAVDPGELIERALGDEAEKLHLWATYQLRQRPSLRPWPALVERCLADRFASVRRDALITVDRVGGSDEVFERGALDGNASVRAVAARLLRRRRPGADLAGLCRRAFAGAQLERTRRM